MKLDYWQSAQKHLLADARFIQKLLEYDRDKISDSVVRQVRPLIESPEFEPSRLRSVSMAAHGLASWVRAIVAYHNSLRVIRPKQARLQEAEEEHARVAASLREKEAELAKVEERMGALAAKLRASKQRKQELEDEVRLTNLKLQRAKQLVQ